MLETGIQELSNINNQKNILLEPSSISSKTNKNGVAFFTLRLLAGMPGDFYVVFQSGDVTSEASITFELRNRIAGVSWGRNVGGSVEIDESNLGTTFSSLPVQPIVKLNYADFQTSNRKNIEVRVYPYVKISVEEYEKQLNKTSASVNGLFNADNEDEFAKHGVETLKNILKTIADGGRLNRVINKNDEGLDYKFTYPEESADGELTFSDLKIEFKKYGKYHVVIMVDGIETPLSRVIEVKSAPSFRQKFVDAFQTIVIVGVSLFVLMANSPYHNVYWIISGVAAILVGYILILVNDGQSETFEIFILIVFALMLLGLFEIIYQLYKRRKLRRAQFTFSARRDLSVEYTYQTLNGKPSQRWVRIF